MVVGREEDTALVKEAAEAAKSKYKQIFKADAPQITVSTDEYLPSKSGKGDHESHWYSPNAFCRHVELHCLSLKPNPSRCLVIYIHCVRSTCS